MYLTRIALNTKRKATLCALTMPQKLHGAIECGFKGERRRNLWRIDWIDTNCYLLVLSETLPDFTHIAGQFGFPGTQPVWETKDYDPFLRQIEEGQVWKFRLRANPVHAVKEKGAQGRGKIIAYGTPDQQKNWLLMRSENLGFSLEKDAFEVVHNEWKNFHKGQGENHIVSLHAASFEGILTITNADLFRKTLSEGIGRGKAYGLGMLTIVKPQSERA